MVDRSIDPGLSAFSGRSPCQTLLKFQIGQHAHSAGCALALPASVWESWKRHLGDPEVIDTGHGFFRIGEARPDQPRPSCLIVFDVDPQPHTGPSPLLIEKRIITHSRELMRLAFDVAPAAALAEGGSADRVLHRIHDRLRALWPEIQL